MTNLNRYLNRKRPPQNLRQPLSISFKNWNPDDFSLQPGFKAISRYYQIADDNLPSKLELFPVPQQLHKYV